MALAKPFTSMPFCLGKVTTNAGTAAQLVSNFTDFVNADVVQAVLIQALPTNTKNVYILLQTSNAAVGSGFTNCFYILTPGAGYLLQAPYGNQIQINAIWIDVDVNGDGVISSIREG